MSTVTSIKAEKPRQTPQDATLTQGMSRQSFPSADALEGLGNGRNRPSGQERTA